MKTNESGEVVINMKIDPDLKNRAALCAMTHSQRHDVYQLALGCQKLITQMEEATKQLKLVLDEDLHFVLKR